MLKVFREQRESLKWILWVVIITLGAGMVLLFVDPPTGVAGGLSVNEVARVGDEQIGIQEFLRNYAQLEQIYRQQFKENFDNFASQLNLPGQAVNSLITEYSIAHQARELGLKATDSEVSERVLSIPAFKNEQGTFVGRERYRSVLEANNLTISSFEDNIRREILRDKLQNLVAAGVGVTPDDIRFEFAKQEQQARIDYILFDPQDINADPTDQEIEEFFKEKIEEYKSAEERQVRYFQIDLKPDQVQLEESEIAARMESVDAQERIRVSQILLKTKPNQDDPEKLKLAERLVRQLKSGASFEQLAFQHSEDDSASRGGDLGFLTRGVMDRDFDKVAFSLKEGEVSDVLKTAFGYHIIKVTSKPREEQKLKRTLAEYQLRDEKAKDQSLKTAEKLLATLREGADWDQVAEREGLETRTTKLFPRSETLKQPQVRSDFNVETFNLKEGDFFTQPYLTPAGYLVPQVWKVESARVPELADVRAKVKEDFIEDKRTTLNRKHAEDVFKAAQESSLEKVGEEQGLNVVTTQFFKAGDTVDDVLKFSPLMHERIAWMKPGEVSPPIRVSNNLIVFQVLEKTPLNEETFKSRSGEIENKLVQSARSSFFQGYIQNVVNELKEHEQIRINQELLDRYKKN